MYSDESVNNDDESNVKFTLNHIEILIRTLTDGVHFKHKKLAENGNRNDENCNHTENKNAGDENDHFKKEENAHGKRVHFIFFNFRKKSPKIINIGKTKLIDS